MTEPTPEEYKAASEKLVSESRLPDGVKDPLKARSTPDRIADDAWVERLDAFENQSKVRRYDQGETSGEIP